MSHLKWIHQKHKKLIYQVFFKFSLLRLVIMDQYLSIVMEIVYSKKAYSVKTRVMRNESLSLQIDGKSRKFSRSRMTTWIFPLTSSHEI